MSEIKSKIRVISSNSGRKYLAVLVDRAHLIPFLEKFREKAGRKFFEMTKKQTDRDRGLFHVTVVGPHECQEIDWSESANKELISDSRDIKFELVGLGFASSDSHSSYFVVVESDDLDITRNSLGLSRKDFHITLGFSDFDVRNARKDRTTLLN